MKTKFLLFCASLLLVGCTLTQKETSRILPFNDLGKKWQLVETFSDEFNEHMLDTTKWNNDPSDWGVWSWEPYNAYQKDGNLRIRMEFQPHQRNNQDLFYKSGIIKSREQITYGYFEARVKGCPRFPGVCPAFWMIGSKESGESSEIDFMEIQEVQGNINQIDCNLHARVISDGNIEWFRERRNWIAPWDPRDDFHIYACENTKDSIRWIIDGKQVLSAPNKHFHLPMKVILSMGLRTPLLKYMAPDPEHPEATMRFPNPAESSAEGFPTEMLVDYIRVWQEVN